MANPRRHRDGKLKIHIKHPGALRRSLGTKKNATIPMSALLAQKAKGGLAAKRAQFAINARHWNHSRGG